MTKDEARERVEVAFQLSELQRAPEWKTLEDFMHSRMHSEQTRLVNGNITSLEQYKNIAGWLRGVTDVLTAAKTADNMAAEARRMLGDDAA